MSGSGVASSLSEEADHAPARSAASACVGVRVEFGRTVALDGVDICITPGEVVALLGPSGSGKSTLLYCLAGILSPAAGEVWALGERIDTLSEAGRTQVRRNSFGFVMQFGHLVPELSALDNASLPLRLQGRPRREARAEAQGLLDRLDVAHLAERLPGQLSGGEQQRVAVARALVAAPAMVFADEPTGALDSRNGEVVIGSLVSLAREHGAAVIVATHDRGVAASADRSVFLRDGRVVAPELDR